MSDGASDVQVEGERLSALSTIKRLVIGGATAAVVRREAVEGGGRKIKVVDASGDVVREISKNDLTVGLLARADIEFSVPEGERPKLLPCLACKARFFVPVVGAVPKLCADCAGQKVCPGFGDEACPKSKAPGKNAFGPKMVAAREGRPWRCSRCAALLACSKQTPEQLSARSQKSNAARTDEQRKAAAAHARKGVTGRQISAGLKRAWSAKSPQQRQAWSLATQADVKPESRRRAASRAWVTRRTGDAAAKKAESES